MLEFAGQVSVAGIVVAGVLAVVIRRPSQARLARQMLAVDSTFNAQVALHSVTPDSAPLEYRHLAVEYALVDEQSARPRRVLWYLVCLGIVATAVSLVLSALEVSDDVTFWQPIWFASVTVGVPLQGVFSSTWADRASQNDRYVELGGSRPEMAESHVVRRLRQTGALQLSSLVFVFVVGLVAVFSSGLVWWSALLTNVVLLYVNWSAVRGADGVAPVRSLRTDIA